MSGHSKWATTKRAKEATDSKRAILFTKLAKTITVAARDKGGDPETNFSLRLAIDKAKAANMPRENIDRAIKRGTGELQGAVIEELIYEGLGPGKTAIIIKCLTDNKNRSAQEVKHFLTKHGGSLASPNALMWQFSKKGVIRLEADQAAKKNPEELELLLIDLGAEDIKKEDEGLVIICKVEDLQKIKKGLEESGLTTEYAEIEYVPKEKVSLNPELTQKNQELFEALDETEDIDDYYTNLNL